MFLVLERNGLTNFLNAQSTPICHAYTLAAASFYSALLGFKIPVRTRKPRRATVVQVQYRYGRPLENVAIKSQNATPEH